MSSPSPSKPRVIKDFEKLDKDIQEQIKLEYPEGFEDNLIYFTNKEGKRVSALPFETNRWATFKQWKAAGASVAVTSGASSSFGTGALQ